MRCVRNCFTISLYINQDIYPLSKLIILDLSLNINIINQRSLINRYKNATPGEYIWVRNNKAFVKRYGNVFIIIIIFNEKNEFSDPIIKIIRIQNVTFCLFFIYNIILFQKLRVRGYWWDTKPFNNYIRRLNKSIII